MRALQAAVAVFLATAGAGRVAAATTDSSGIPSPQASSAAHWRIPEGLHLNVYGFAHHPDREVAHRFGMDNDFNPGLALHYELPVATWGVTFGELGTYYDSGRNWALFAALGYQFKLGPRWRLGGAVAAMHSPTYNRGTGFVGMIPLLTYDAGGVKLNGVYFPKFGEFNKLDAFGFYVAIGLGRSAWEPD